MIDERRPLFCIAVYMMAGAAAAYTAVDKKSILIFAASAMLAAIFAKITSRGPRLLLAAAAGAVLVFVTLWSYGNLGLGAYQGREVTVRGIVVSAAPQLPDRKSVV